MGKTYQIILFDLDGTLTDPFEGITKSVQYAARHFGIQVEDRKELASFIGPPLQDSFRKYFGFDELTTREAIKKYREYFSTKGIYENLLYPGIPPMLQQLKSAEKTLILATSKPLVFAKQILDFFKLDEYFDYFSGSELDGRRSRKGEVIAHALDQANISDLSSVLMVGDREHDVIGAKENGIDCAGVLYGYGSRTELLSSGVNYLAENPEELLKIILTPHKT